MEKKGAEEMTEEQRMLNGKLYNPYKLDMPQQQEKKAFVEKFNEARGRGKGAPNGLSSSGICPYGRKCIHRGTILL